MTTFTYTWNAAFEAIPADSDDLSEGAQRIRDHKLSVKERLAVDHKMAGDEFDGEHSKVTFFAQASDPTTVTDKGYLYTKDVSGKVELFWKDEDANVTQLTSAGAISLDIPVVAKTGAYTVVAADKKKLIDATSGTWTLSLTAAATLGDGFWFAVKNSGTGVITIDPDGSETIDGSTTITLDTGQSCFVFCNGTLFRTIGIAVPNKVAHYQKQETSGTIGPSLPSGSWQTYPIDTEVSDPDSIGSLSSNQITLGAGTYIIDAYAISSRHTGSAVDAVLRLRNVTDGATIAKGPKTVNSLSIPPTCSVHGILAITASKAIELQIYMSGANAGAGSMSTGENEVYASVMITKIK